MTRWALIASVMAMAWLVLSSKAETANVPTIKEIMGKLHKGANAPLSKVKKEMQADEPAWEDIQKLTKEFVTWGASLEKNDPPKGEKESWQKLAKKYYENAKAMDEAARNKDKSAGLAIQAKLARSCTDCHRAHKP